MDAKELTNPARVQSLLTELDWCIANVHAGPRTAQAIEHARAVIAALHLDAEQAPLTDEQIIERCKVAGIKWIPPELPDEVDYEIGFPGLFDMVSMDEMRALLATPVAPGAAAQGEAVRELTANDADMVWPDHDGETFYHTLDDAVEQEISNAWPIEAPVEFKFQIAKRIPAVTIRVTEITENGHEWEIVRAAPAAPGAAAQGEAWSAIIEARKAMLSRLSEVQAMDRQSGGMTFYDHELAGARERIFMTIDAEIERIDRAAAASSTGDQA
jgi:hypothetical protein